MSFKVKIIDYFTGRRNLVWVWTGPDWAVFPYKVYGAIYFLLEITDKEGNEYLEFWGAYVEGAGKDEDGDIEWYSLKDPFCSYFVNLDGTVEACDVGEEFPDLKEAVEEKLKKEIREIKFSDNYYVDNPFERIKLDIKGKELKKMIL